MLFDRSSGGEEDLFIYLFIHFCVGRFHASDCNFVIETKKFDLPANPAGGQGAKAPAGTCAAGEWGCAT